MSLLCLPWCFSSTSPLLLTPFLRVSLVRNFSSSSSSSSSYLFYSTQPSSFTKRTPSSSEAARCIRLLNRCRNADDLKRLKSILIVNGLIRDEPLVGKFFISCSDLGAPHLALSGFESFKRPSLFLQNVIIRCLCNHGLFENLLCLYQKYHNLGCPSDNYTFPLVIKACSALNAVSIGKQTHGLILTSGFKDNIVVQTAVVDFYAKTGQMKNARMLFDTIPGPDVVSWNALLAGYSINGLSEESFEVLSDIFKVGLKPNASTLASIIPVCVSLGFGQLLHAYSVKSGFFLDESLITAFISMYAGFGHLSISFDIFASSSRSNVAAWNAIISACTQQGNSAEAFLCFRNMLQSNVRPDMITFVSVIPSCKYPTSIYSGESLHTCAIKTGTADKLSVTTSLLLMYAKLGDLSSAEILFYQIPNRNLVAWNSIMSGYIQNGHWDTCLGAFCELQSSGFEPDAVSIISVLSSCSKLKAVALGKSAHAFILRKGFDSINVTNALLAFYSDSSLVGSSFMLFKRMLIRDTVSWNSMISGCVSRGETEAAVGLFLQMQEEGVMLDSVTLISMLPSFHEYKELVQGMAIHCLAIKSGVDVNISLANALVSMYINCEDLASGKLLFETMPEKDMITWNALITGYRYHGLNNEAMVLFNQIIKQGQQPTYVTLLNIVPICCTLSQGKSIHAHAVRNESILETPLLTSLMFMYTRFGDIDRCFWLFDMGDRRDISLWNAIISVHAHSEKAHRAVGFFIDLHQTGLQPDHCTILSLISACVQITGESLSDSVLAYAIKSGFDKDVAISNAFIDLCARCGNISSARELFNGLLEKNVVSWSVMINGYGLNGHGSAALELLSEMKLLGMNPDSVTYLGALSACAHAGLVEQSKMVFNSMQNDGIMPKIEHYTCIVDLLGRTGHLNEAYDIATRLPCKPPVSLLESLLGACRIYGNVDLGEEIGRVLCNLDPENPVPYVMLYNIYAAAGKWVDANKVRADMEGRKLRKTPGFSLVEGNECHSYNVYTDNYACP